MVKFRVVSSLLGLLLLSNSVASDDSLPNWVSPISATGSACYRKTYLSNDSCATGYDYDGIATCWAQCPLDYPVECGMECIPQSADCTSEVIDKVASVATVALNAVTLGVFGDIEKASKALKLGVKCGQALFAATSDLVSYVDELQANATPSQQLWSLANQSNLVVYEIPSAVCTCLGLKVTTEELETASQVVDVVKQVVTEVIENGNSLLDPDTFLSFMNDAGVGDSVQNLDTDSLSQLQDMLNAGTTCGTSLQTIIHQVTQLVASLKDKDPATTLSKIREALGVSKLFLTDIPAVTNNCVRNLTDDAYTTRDSLRAMMSTITDNLTSAAVDDDGNAISTSDYFVSVADMGLDAIATFDPTGIADMMSKFIQTVCGPTDFIGEIDDGSLEEALALTTEDVAFSGSFGTWNKSGDGTVTIVFESLDTDDVTVEIHSGGDTVDEVKVASGETVTWNSTVEELQDKTLYLDRWRPGLLGVSGSGGGSLLMWVPHSSTGGQIYLHALLNGGDYNASSSASGGSNESPVQQEDSDTASQGESATPAPTQATDDGTTPAPTTTTDDSASTDDIVQVTPAPTTLDTETHTKHKHKLRIHITSN